MKPASRPPGGSLRDMIAFNAPSVTLDDGALAAQPSVLLLR